MLTLLRQSQPVRRMLAVYCLAWRMRASHPWHSEEFLNRFEAHERYLQLKTRGYEASLETREKSTVDA